MRLILLSLLTATPAAATERVVALSSFDRVRIDVPVTVRIVTGASPSARIGGSDARVEVQQNGTTVTVRRNMGRWQERPAADGAAPPVVTLTTRSLAGIMVAGDAEVTVDRMAAPRVDLTLGGPGTITVAAVDADQANVGVIEGGKVTLAGHTSMARLTTNGDGTIDAAGLDVGDLTVRIEGPGDITARARFTAAVTSTGKGSVTISGSPKCLVRGVGEGIRCGVATPVR